jgi:hypothetical protein
MYCELQKGKGSVIIICFGGTILTLLWSAIGKHCESQILIAGVPMR